MARPTPLQTATFANALGLSLLLVAPPKAIPTRAEIGKKLFFETRLSNPPGQSCASCHAPERGFGNPTQAIGEGAVKGRFGSRKAPGIAYARYTPDLRFLAGKGEYFGGQFWDGRASGLEEQATGPLFNPLEMNLSGAEELQRVLLKSPIRPDLEAAFGKSVLRDANQTLRAVIECLAAYERSSEFGLFTSKYDAFLQGKTRLSEQELSGLKIFEDPKRGNCAGCHPSRSRDGKPPLFSDFTFTNSGAPKNPKNPFYRQAKQFNPAGSEYIDKGLAAFTGRIEDEGRFKTPSLRNVALNAPYFHNGAFQFLAQVVDFYNERDTGKFGPAEVNHNIDSEEIHDLHLKDREKADLVAFLLTLTDGFVSSNTGK